MLLINEVYLAAAKDSLLQLVVIAVFFDTIFGCLRAIKEKEFNSSFGIDGALRKVGIMMSLLLLLFADALIQIDLVGFVPQNVRELVGMQEHIGMTTFFSLLYLAYETVSILKNMALCGLPVNRVWVYVRKLLGKYTDELPHDK